MVDPTWHVGPLGHLRPFVCPERDVKLTPVRYGGTHQGLSGARSMDTTGYRLDMSFSFKYLTEDEYAFLELLHYRMLPGPYWLLNPLKRNKLTPESSMARVGMGTARGATLTGNSHWLPHRAVPFAGATVRSATHWYGRSETAQFLFDQATPLPVLNGEAITGSVYLSSDSAAGATTAHFAWINELGDDAGSTDPVTWNVAQATWERHTITATPPDGAVGAQLVIQGGTQNLNLALAQVEAGDQATAWQPGGGAPLVLVDQLDASSPRHPYTDVVLTLKEA